MKKILLVFALVFGISICFFLYGCAKKPEIYGSRLGQMKATPVAEILKQPNQYIGKSVRVEGKIIQECPAGGWFILKDNTGVIFVNLHPTDIAIPQAVNRNVAAQGKVKEEDNQISVIGGGVELK
ncbi:MAG: hypothetical protein M0R48_01580 [Candidatus Omnitrophica bacterium]|jgi:uncharacterized protein YdeI (BOF family)|nr:hypothetical protein [Candidatus Omnitrophota bacterium]